MMNFLQLIVTLRLAVVGRSVSQSVRLGPETLGPFVLCVK